MSATGEGVVGGFEELEGFEGFDVDGIVAEAWRARERAYAPYSRFAVGAVVVSDAGAYGGANVENAAYSVAICAERVAGTAAIVAGARRIDAVAVVADTEGPVTPCGVCRQFLREFDPDGRMVIVSESRTGERLRRLLVELLPESFGPEGLLERGGEGGPSGEDRGR